MNETPAADAGAFFRPANPIPHGGRAKRIVQDHPEVRKLIGRNVGTFWITAGIVAFQVAMAWALRGSPWWLVLGARMDNWQSLTARPAQTLTALSVQTYALLGLFLLLLRGTRLARPAD